jgi:RNA polymerase sigma-70 factor (ECF subfamily)
VIRHALDDEAAFQANFLVLANWLDGVAYCTIALHARQRALRRSKREREAATMIAPSGEFEELRRVLDEELHRLPEKYRAPLVLCYLEGKPNEEAARMMGWPSASMSYRLARGLELLRQRLEGRLAGLTIQLPMILLGNYFQPAAVPPLLAKMTAHTAAKLVSGKMAVDDLISVSVRDLMEAILLSLAAFRGRWPLIVLLLVSSLFSLGAALCASIPSLSQQASGEAIQWPRGASPCRLRCEDRQRVGLFPQRGSDSPFHLPSSGASRLFCR